MNANSKFRTNAWADAQYEAAGLIPPLHRPHIPGGPQDVASVLSSALRRVPNKLALIGRYSRVTFRQLDAMVNAAAAYLSALGVHEGVSVAASVPNDVDIMVAFLAVQRLGGIWVGVARNLAPPEKAFLLSDSHTSLYLADRATALELQERGLVPARVSQIVDMDPTTPTSEWKAGIARFNGAAAPKVEIDPWAPAAIAYTSGTTGRPKGVVHTQHSIILASLMAERMARDIREEVIRATPSPLTILNMIIMGPLATLAAGLTHVCMDRIDAVGVAEWLSKEKINTLTLVPTVILDLLTRQDIDPRDLKSVTWMVGGGAMVPERLPALYEGKFGHPLTIGYGLTEIPTSVSRSQDDTPRKQGAIGRALPHLEVSILDQEDHLVPSGESGEICIRAAQEGEWAGVYTLPLGYWQKPDATAQLLRSGWIHTGDIGFLDASGNLFINDRRSDLILRGGANVYPAEVERVLRSDHRVRDVAVVGKPDERLGQRVVAFIQPLPDTPIGGMVDSLRQLCEREIARYKVPEDWRIVTDMPRNAAGKVLKGELSKMLSENPSTG